MHARPEKRRGRTGSSRRPPRRPALALFCVYALFVAYGTLLPFQFVADRQALQARPGSVNWNPVHLVTGVPTPPADLVLNIFFFVPLGIIGLHAQNRRPRWAAVLRCTAAGAMLSVAVEALQFFIPARNPATSDVLTNVLGTFVGAVSAAEVQRQLGRAPFGRMREWMQRESLLPVLVGCAVLVALLSLVPFDLDLWRGWSVRALRRAEIDPWHDPGRWSAELPAVLTYAVLSGLGFRVARRLRRAPALATALGCMASAGFLALVLEVLQLTVRSRIAATRDILAALAGIVAGIAAAAALGDGERGRHGWKLAALAYATCVVVRAVLPFDFRLDPQAIGPRLTRAALMPYHSYYYRATVAAVGDFLDGLLVYVPLAFVLARLRGERRGEHPLRLAAGVAGPCAGLALVLELLHLLMPGRGPELSDVLTAVLGGGLGAFTWRWAAHSPGRAPAEAEAARAVALAQAYASAAAARQASRPAGDAAPISPASS